METLMLIVSILSAGADQGFNKLNDPPLQYTSKVLCKDLCKLISIKDLRELGPRLECGLEDSDYDSTSCPGCSATTRSWMQWPLGKIMPKLIANGCLQTTKTSTATVSSKNIAAPNTNREAIVTLTTNSPLMELDKAIQPIDTSQNENDTSLIKKSCVPQNSSNSEDNDNNRGSDVATTNIVSETLSLTTNDAINITYLRCTKSCYTGPTYNLVCGTDLQTYVNELRIDCARSCGRDIKILCEGPCPVCAASYYTTKATSNPITPQTQITTINNTKNSV